MAGSSSSSTAATSEPVAQTEDHSGSKAALVDKIMSTEGPIIDLIVIRASTGKAELLSNVDMTPKLNPAARILGGQGTFVGQYPDLGVMVMRKRETVEGKDAKNPYKLPVPFADATILGDILLVRVNDESEPESITLDEWASFCERAAQGKTFVPEIADGEETEANFTIGFAPAEDADYDSEEDGDYDPEAQVEDADEEEHGNEGGDDDDDDSDDEEEAPLSELQETLLEKIITNFQAVHGRAPTEEELMPILKKLEAAVNAAPIDGEESEEDEAEEDEAEEDEAEGEGEGKSTSDAQAPVKGKGEKRPAPCENDNGSNKVAKIA